MSTREDLISSKNARVASIDLEPGEISPWHYHSEVVEHLICLDGSIELQFNEPETSIEMQLARRYTVKPMRAHRLANTGKSKASYLLIQDGKYDSIPFEP